ncbi:uncharacterized protein N7479_007933 [Penicillium vulpinum]|uniref:uncharacterized protein n=1 Tax=Penicillium vulpinum TaxID=29845 RepID=UPI002547E2A0|nr:uncharacterized protein N7479_007933 [Penicillium vulpinum]KAJ5960783.1 hypothetical protein N7479_007933 [Penicillium vulpinum]
MVKIWGGWPEVRMMRLGPQSHGGETMERAEPLRTIKLNVAPTIGTVEGLSTGNKSLSASEKNSGRVADLCSAKILVLLVAKLVSVLSIVSRDKQNATLSSVQHDSETGSRCGFQRDVRGRVVFVFGDSSFGDGIVWFIGTIEPDGCS